MEQQIKNGDLVLIIPVYWENTTGGSKKFWEIAWTTRNSWTTAWGRIGSKGQSAERHFSSTWEAKKEYNNILSSKQSKGYVKHVRPVNRASILIEGFKGGVGLVLEKGTYSSSVLDDTGSPVVLPNEFLTLFSAA